MATVIPCLFLPGDDVFVPVDDAISLELSQRDALQ